MADTGKYAPLSHTPLSDSEFPQENAELRQVAVGRRRYYVLPASATLAVVLLAVFALTSKSKAISTESKDSFLIKSNQKPGVLQPPPAPAGNPCAVAVPSGAGPLAAKGSSPAYVGPPLAAGQCVLVASYKTGDDVLEAAYANDIELMDHLLIGEKGSSRIWRRVEGLNPLRIDIPLGVDLPPGTPCSKVAYTPGNSSSVTTNSSNSPASSPQWGSWYCADFRKQQATCPAGTYLLPPEILLEVAGKDVSCRDDLYKGTAACCCGTTQTTTTIDLWSTVLLVNPSVQAKPLISGSGSSVQLSSNPQGFAPNDNVKVCPAQGLCQILRIARIEVKPRLLTSNLGQSASNARLLTPTTYWITFDQSLQSANWADGTIFALEMVQEGDVLAYEKNYSKEQVCKADVPCLTCLNMAAAADQQILDVTSTAGFKSGAQITISPDSTTAGCAEWYKAEKAKGKVIQNGIECSQTTGIISLSGQSLTSTDKLIKEYDLGVKVTCAATCASFTCSNQYILDLTKTTSTELTHENCCLGPYPA